MSIMSSLLKDLAEGALVSLRTDALARSWNRGRTMILAYHNVVPHGRPSCGDRSLHLPRARFARHLDLLDETHEIVPLSSVSSPPEAPAAGTSRPRVAITFDDAYRGALTAGLDAVASRGLPATVFVAPGLLDQDAFWWDALAHEESGAVDDAVREHALTELGGRHADVMRWAGSEGLVHRRVMPPHARPATPEMVRSVSRSPDVTVASHGWSHLNFPASSRPDLEQELSRPLDWFEASDVDFEPWIAYPYGRHSARVRRIAGDVYPLAFTTAGGFATGPRERASDRTRVPRRNVPAGASLRRFRLLTSGAMDVLPPGGHG